MNKIFLNSAFCVRKKKSIYGSFESVIILSLRIMQRGRARFNFAQALEQEEPGGFERHLNNSGRRK
jgi:hypothetical protein